jgi:uncharacterized protein YbbC (DUF1343 family)
MKFGIDRLLADPALRAPLAGKRIALLAHPASVTEDSTHSLDALSACSDLRLSAAFGPQHGLRGDKQDNMVESEDFTDPSTESPSSASMARSAARPASRWARSTSPGRLQDLGCRIYTFITTLLYVLEAAAQHGKTVWVLDRPTPPGARRGPDPRPGWESFVGAGPMPMRHGPDAGRARPLVHRQMKLDVDYRVIEMEGLRAEPLPGTAGRSTSGSGSIRAQCPQTSGWPALMPGTVMLEGATLSEGRGTTVPLEISARPTSTRAPSSQKCARSPRNGSGGCQLREISFEPTFHKHVGKLCHGVHIHAEGPAYDHAAFKPWRVQALAFKAIRRLYPDYDSVARFPLRI